MQTILGSNGVIGKNTALSLSEFTKDIRLVSRNPQKVNPDDQLFSADLKDPGQTLEAVRGSEVVYLTVGIKYNATTWKAEWPLIMKNVLDACAETDAKLVFFDNVYAYGKVDGWMTEDTPYNPCSRKGEVRAEILEMLHSRNKSGEVKTLVARAADFYGPETPLSFVNLMVMENLAKGKKPQWLMDAHKRHSFTYTPDAGLATALLGNTPDAYNQVWHVPTQKNVLTGEEFIRLAATAFARPDSYMVLGNWMLKAAGLFIPEIRESLEMMYQNTSDYLFSSRKFEERFGFEPTSYKRGIMETARSYSG